jgi:hypothetical protein
VEGEGVGVGALQRAKPLGVGEDGSESFDNPAIISPIRRGVGLAASNTPDESVVQLSSSGVHTSSPVAVPSHAASGSATSLLELLDGYSNLLFNSARSWPSTDQLSPTSLPSEQS